MVFPILCTIISLSSYATGLAIVAEVIRHTRWTKWVITYTFVSSAVSDVISNVALSVYLRKSRRTTSMKSTASTIESLVYWAIETGVMTGLADITITTVYWTLPKTFVWLGCYLAVPNIYTNACLASLNSRLCLRKMQASAHAIENQAPRQVDVEGVLVHITQTVELSESTESKEEELRRTSNSSYGHN